MATPVERMQAVINALKDDTVSNAFLLRIGNAYEYTYSRDVSLTNPQKARLFLNVVRGGIRQVVKDAIESQAAAAAAAAADSDAGIGDDE